MPEYRRPLHRRMARVLSLMDAGFLEQAQCFFGGGTQLVMAHGEFRESRDIVFLVSSQAGLRMLRQTVNERSLGKIFKGAILLEREVRTDRDAIRTFINEEASAEPLKFEIVLEGRIELRGSMDAALGVPTLELPTAIAEKLLANADRGRAREHRSRDAIDLAFLSLQVDEPQFLSGYDIAQAAYGEVIVRQLDEVLKTLRLDAKYRAQCIDDLLIEDAKGLRKGLDRLQAYRRAMRKREAPAKKPAPR
ncbi:MAG: hypothetical protein A3G81_11225 [Betaproteobacteria bacterium RIFCSPLOWO2_12_FULL_65_14]|nr:MAG: hypothetical protein A3G81_11225 [Betaproteobacteria bacterium RIFCSPLOWO2_12_FULL_65_14]